jgi:MFS family permease
LFSRVFAAFKYREFRLMWLGACTSTIGTWMQKAAQSWLVLELSQSKFLLGLDSFLGEIPIFLLSLFGGVASDRFDRRKLLIASQVGQMSTALVLAFLFATDTVQVWHILTLSFFTGCVQAFGGPAYQAILPMMVPKTEVQNAIAMNSIQFNIARLIGPMLGGWALVSLGPAWCFSLNGLSFLAVIFALMAMTPKRGGGNRGESVLASIRGGIDFVSRRAGMLPLIALAFFMTFFGFPMMVFLPVMVKEVFGQGSIGYTHMLTVSAAGSIVGGLIVAGLSHSDKKGRYALLNLIALGGLIIAFSQSTNLWVSYVVLFLSSGALIGTFSMIASLVQHEATDEMRGRVMSLYNVAFRGGGPIGALLCGELIEYSSAPTVLAGCGALLALMGLWFLVVQRRIPQL